MEFSAVVRRRRMVRRFDPEAPVPDATVDRLLDAARRTPSAGFTQGVSFLVLTDPGVRDDFWALTAEPGPADRWLHGLRTAPALVLVWTSETVYRERYAEPDKAAARARHRPDRSPDPATDPADDLPWSVPFWYVDAGMAVQALLYGAVDAGLGAAFVALPEPAVPRLRRRFGVPEAALPVGLVALGRPASDEPGPATRPGSPARRPRKPAGSVIHRDHWSDDTPTGTDHS